MSSTSTTTGRPAATKLFSALVGLTSIVILLQAVWAGIFIREGKDNNSHWVSVHDWGARAAILLALISAIVAVTRLRSRRELVIGSVALFVLLFLEAYLGGLIGDNPGVQAIHFPLALALVGLAVWLPLQSRGAAAASLQLGARTQPRQW